MNEFRIIAFSFLLTFLCFDLFLNVVLSIRDLGIFAKRWDQAYRMATIFVLSIAIIWLSAQFYLFLRAI